MEPTERLAEIRQWVVVGVSEDESRWGNRIFRSLNQAGYEVFGVGIKGGNVQGKAIHKKLSEVPLPLESRASAVVDIVVPPPVTENVVKEAYELGYRNFWMQPGAESEKAINWAQQQPNATVIHHDCILRHQKQSWS